MHYRAFLFIKFFSWSVTPLSGEKRSQVQKRKMHTDQKERKCPRKGRGLGYLQSNETSLSSIYSDYTSNIYSAYSFFSTRGKHFPGKEKRTANAQEPCHHSRCQSPDPTPYLGCCLGSRDNKMVWRQYPIKIHAHTEACMMHAHAHVCLSACLFR